MLQYINFSVFPSISNTIPSLCLPGGCYMYCSIIMQSPWQKSIICWKIYMQEDFLMMKNKFSLKHRSRNCLPRPGKSRNCIQESGRSRNCLPWPGRSRNCLPGPGRSRNCLPGPGRSRNCLPGHGRSRNWARIFKQSMGVRNRVGIGVFVPARQAT